MVKKDNKNLFKDNNHYSPYGSQILGRYILQKVIESNAGFVFFIWGITAPDWIKPVNSPLIVGPKIIVKIARIDIEIFNI